MKRKIFLSVCLLTLCWGVCFAQDVIVTRDAKIINARITEVSSDSVKYKNLDNLDGPTYTLPKSQIASILYQNGTADATDAGSVKEEDVLVDTVVESPEDRPESTVDFQLTLSGQDLSPKEKAERLRFLRTFVKKGTKVFVQCNCWDEPQFEHTFLTEFGQKGIWRIVQKPKDADFILKVQAVPRLVPNPMYGDFTVYDMYALVFDTEEHLLWKSDLFFGDKVWTPVWGDIMKGATGKFIKVALLKDIRGAKEIYGDQLDILGEYKVSKEKYETSEDWFWQGMDCFSQYNHKQAMEMFTKALRLNPYNALAYKYRALAYMNLSRYNNARDDIVVAMKLDPFCTQNDTIYADIMSGGYKKRVRLNNTLSMISGIANAVNQSITAVAGASAGGHPSPVSSGASSASGSTGTAVKGRQVCSFCHGTGQNPARERPAFYNYNDEDFTSSTCSICGSSSNHYHKSCPSCMGKGYR
jgi:hypothetical protein